MSFVIRQLHDQNEWRDFVLAQPYTLFVQSPSYGTFYEAMGEEWWIFGIFENDRLVGGSLVVSTHAKRGNFLFLPYGPVLPEKRGAEALTALTAALLLFAKEHQYDFLRVSPYLEDTEEVRTLFRQSGYRPAPMHMLAETTWLLDLQHSEEALMAGMKKNHRNLIRRCERSHIRVESSRSLSALAQFHEMHDATAERHHFHRFSRSYVDKEFCAFAKRDEAVVFYAFLPDGRLDASAVVIYFGSMAAYRHGASYGHERTLPTSYLLQWEAIKEAKRRGCLWYNFWGVAPPDAPRGHPFAGITHFKTGFGGYGREVLHCQDFPVSSWYSINWIIETFRRRYRGFLKS